MINNNHIRSSKLLIKNLKGLYCLSLVAFWCLVIFVMASTKVAASDVSSVDVTAGNSNTIDTKKQKEINAANQRAMNEKEKVNQARTAAAINKVPGVHVTPSQFAIPEEDTIEGFHPVKRMLEPIVRLEKNTIQLQQQIMKLEGPIAGLQKPMLGLHDKMGSVEARIDGISSQLTSMQQEVAGVRQLLTQTDTRVAALQDPIIGIQKPLTNVAGPLTEVREELAKVEALIASVLLAIVLAAIAIAVGTPVAAIIIYRNRKKLFPNLRDRDFPVANASETDT